MSETLDVEAVRDLLPHRYPFLMVDKILELLPGERIVGLKNVTINEPFFDGHFPGQAIMPGVMIIETMAQVAGLIMLSLPEHKNKLAFLGGVNKCRFHKPVVPGDTLIIEAMLVDMRGMIGKASMFAKVNGEIVAKCEMMFKIAVRGREAAMDSTDATGEHDLG